jgi:uncharacterized protein YacL (UPF0231 family)
VILVAPVEYSFSMSDINRPQARLNMEAEAFGHWLSIEMASHSEVALENLALAIIQLRQGQFYEFEYQGREFLMHLNREQAVVTANTVLQNSPEQLYHQESSLDDAEYSFEDSDDGSDYINDNSSGLTASCGLEDFQRLLNAWISYLKSTN